MTHPHWSDATEFRESQAHAPIHVWRVAHRLVNA